VKRLNNNKKIKESKIDIKTERKQDRQKHRKTEKERQKVTRTKKFSFSFFVIHPKLQRPPKLDNLKTKEKKKKIKF
jgi:hypothetical protein